MTKMITKNKPPKFGSWILKKLSIYEELYEKLGDFEEIFNEKFTIDGKFKAKLWYFQQILMVMPALISYSTYRRAGMFKNYFIIAIRSFRKNRAFSFINVAGLALGMAGCLLILLFVADEFSYDNFHVNADRIFRLNSTSTIGNVTRHYAMIPDAMAPSLTEEIPEIETFVRMFRINDWRFRYDDKLMESRQGFIADSTFFNIFSFNMIKGDPSTCLDVPRALVITEKMALSIFGDEDPIEKILTLGTGENEREFLVRGVVENIPVNSHFSFEFIVSMSTFTVDGFSLTNWIGFNTYTYFLMSENADLDVIDSKIPPIVEKYSGEQLRAGGIRRKYELEKLSDIYLRSHREAELGTNGDITYVYLFSAVAAFILFIACINFINLSTARSATRAREVGLRKVFGAYRRQLINQFLSESLLLTLLSLIIGILIVITVLPVFNELAGKSLDYTSLLKMETIVLLLSMFLFTGVVAGSFPAFILSAFRPVAVLQGKLSSLSKNFNLRKVLVVFQFAISITLIASTIMIYNQLMFMKNKNLGFNKEQLLIIRNNSPQIFEQKEAFKEELLRYPSIVSVAGSNNIPGEFASDPVYQPEGKTNEESVRCSAFEVDFDFIKTYGINVKFGRDFSKDIISDTATAMIINETTSGDIGWTDDAIGKQMLLLTLQDNYGNPNRIVTGVVNDFHHQSLRYEVTPTILLVNERAGRFITVRLNRENISETITYISSIWKDFENERPIQYSFLDEEFDQKYTQEENAGSIYIYFSIMAIFIACLGLLGLASYTAEQKTKEIGIRKVLGAEIKSIVYQLSRDFTVWVIIANLFAWPAAYYLMSKWSQNFAYQAGIELWVFIVSGVISLIIAILTISYQAYKTARTNPVDSLKYE